jgi:hypothetical protein
MHPVVWVYGYNSVLFISLAFSKDRVAMEILLPGLTDPSAAFL